MTENTARAVVKAFGGQTKFADALGGIPITTVHGWLTRGRIPEWRMDAIKKAARKAKVDLPNMDG